MADKVSKDGVNPGLALKGKPRVKSSTAMPLPIAKAPGAEAIAKPKPPLAAKPAVPPSAPLAVEAPVPPIPQVATPAPRIEDVAEKTAEVAQQAMTAIAAATPAVDAAPAMPEVAEPALNAARSVEKPAIPATLPAVTEQAASKTASLLEQTFAGLFNNFRLEDTTMAVTDFSGFQDAITEAQAKAKAALDKSTSALGEVTEFSKGNVEAVIESGKIFAEGVQGLGSELVAESRSAFETITADIKELAAVKSPTDFFRIQGDLMRKNFDSAVAYGSKNSEAVLKLVSDSFAPISGRVSVALEKARSTSV